MRLQKLTLEEFRKIAKIISDLTGIHLSEEKLTLLSNRLRKRLRALSLEEFDEYHKLLLNKAKLQEELPHFLSAVTTNETYFFRNDNLWKYIQETWIPENTARKKDAGSKRVRVWSAASSSGEEAYTMAICLHEGVANVAAWDISVVASDISDRVLERARNGVYNDYAVSKTPKSILLKWFDKKDDGFVVKERLRKVVNFKFHNLRDPFPNANFDLIFLRNVLMYFDTPMKQRVIRNVSSALARGGNLYIGDVDPIRQTPALRDVMKLEYCGPNLYHKPIAATVGSKG